MWCKIAQATGMSIEAAQQTLSLSEVRLWEAFFKTEYQRLERSDWYMAQIAMKIHQTIAEKGRRFKVKDFLLTFYNPDASFAGEKEDQGKMMHWVRSLIAAGKKKTK